MLFFYEIYERLGIFRQAITGLGMAIALVAIGIFAPMPPLVKALSVGVGAAALLVGAIEQARALRAKR